MRAQLRRGGLGCASSARACSRVPVPPVGDRGHRGRALREHIIFTYCGVGACGERGSCRLSFRIVPIAHLGTGGRPIAFRAFTVRDHPMLLLGIRGVTRLRLPGTHAYSRSVQLLRSILTLHSHAVAMAAGAAAGALAS